MRHILRRWLRAREAPSPLPERLPALVLCLDRQFPYCLRYRAHTSDNLQEGYAVPTAMAQQLMGACQRLDAVIDRSHDIRGGRVGTLCLGDDGTDRREHILYAM